MTNESRNSKTIRKIILTQSKRAGVGHIGSNLSVADILATLYGNILDIADPADPNRDRFILSKGHASLALYAALYLRGWLSLEDLNSFCQDNTMLGVHPERILTGVDFCTGSLGIGMSYAAGAALAARLQNSNRKVFALISDAECNEGIVWEAAMFSAHHKLSNLYIIIDENGQQALGYTKDVLNLAPLAVKWQAFGWDVQEVNGHDQDEIVYSLGSCQHVSDKPHVLIAHTVFGKGVSFMENKIKWHYWPMNDQEYELAMKENQE